jgi:hypothetical protein
MPSLSDLLTPSNVLMSLMVSPSCMLMSTQSYLAHSNLSDGEAKYYRCLPPDDWYYWQSQTRQPVPPRALPATQLQCTW